MKRCIIPPLEAAHILYNFMAWRGQSRTERNSICPSVLLQLTLWQPLPNLKLELLRNRSKEAQTVLRGPGRVKKKQGTVEIVTLLDGCDYICPPGLQ